MVTPEFDGLIHWRGRDRSQATVAGPGRAAELVDRPFAIDPPGHGLSDDWIGEAPSDWSIWNAVLKSAAESLNITRIVHEALPVGDPDRLFPDLAPDRFGSHLTRSWAIVRAAHLFMPWYQADASHAREFDPAALDPERLAREHRALLRSRSARAYSIARSQEEENHVDP